MQAMRDHEPWVLPVVDGGQGRTLPVQLFSLAAAMEATVVEVLVDPRMSTMDTPFHFVGAVPTASDLFSLGARAQ